MEVLIPEEQRKTFQWMIGKLAKEEFTQLAAAVPNQVERIRKAPLISAMVKVMGETKIRQFIHAQLIWLDAQINVANGMNSLQINFAVDTLMERYPHETLADFVLCFRRGAQGYYGSSYHQLDTSVIMGWMEKHIEEKSLYIERDVTTGKEAEEETVIDYEAFKARLEDERAQARENRIQEIFEEDKKADRPRYVPLTTDQVNERLLHNEYLRAKWKHDQSPLNRDPAGVKILVQFMSEEDWRAAKLKSKL